MIFNNQKFKDIIFLVAHNIVESTSYLVAFLEKRFSLYSILKDG